MSDATHGDGRPLAPHAEVAPIVELVGGPGTESAPELAEAEDAPKERPRARRKPLGTQVEIHDHEQLEVRFDYGLGSDAVGQRYEVDAYFFVPRNVGVGRANYQRTDFYGDVTALMRLDASALPLRRLADVNEPVSPLWQLRTALEGYRTSSRPPPSLPLAVPVKLYAYLYGEAVKSEVRKLRNLVRDLSEEAEVTELSRARVLLAFREATARMREGLWAFRRIRGAFWPFERLCHRQFVEALRSADEHMSLYLEEKLALLMETIAARERLYDGSGFVARIRAALAGLAADEDAYRAKFGYLRLRRGAVATGGEFFTYGVSQLKKSVHQALYLDLRTVRNEDAFFRNAVGAVAAALGAIWAFATQLPATIANLPASTQALLFLGAVGAYVLKDRIKAVSNEYLTRRLRRHDHTFWIEAGPLVALGLGMLKIRLREGVHFVSSDEVSPRVLSQRLSRRTLRQSEVFAEEVIHYRKQLDVFAQAEDAPPPEGYRVRDILRFNVRHFLVRLDEPIDHVAYYDSQRGNFARAQLPKVYHLNLVLEMRRADAKAEGKGSTAERIEHLRVVLNKEGIVRVEKVPTLT